MERIKCGQAQAILTNSGNANAATGRAGYDDALAMSQIPWLKDSDIPDDLCLWPQPA